MTQYAEDLFGFSTTNNKEPAPYVEKAWKYVTVNGQALPNIMEALSALDCFTGIYDIEKWYYDITITDTRACAKELGITETFLGYIMGMLAEYSPLEFNNYRVSFKFNLN